MRWPRFRRHHAWQRPPVKLHRRYHPQDCRAICQRCGPVSGYATDPEPQARIHAASSGHEVRVTRRALVIIRPQETAGGTR